MGTLATFDEIFPGVDPASLSTKQLQTHAEWLNEVHLQQARGLLFPHGSGLEHLEVGAAAFIEYAIPHETTGSRIENDFFHEDWHRFFDLNQWAVVLAPIGHGKTVHIPIGRTLYDLGKNPSTRVAIICATEPQANERVDVIRQHVEDNELVKRVFPDLQRAKRRGAPWGVSAIEVERPTKPKNASVTAFGVGSKSIQGGRFDRIRLDDVADEKSSDTPEKRDKLTNWWDSIAFGRQPPDGTGRIEAIGTPWAHGDLLDVLSKRQDFGAQVWSAVLNPDDDPMDWDSLWTHMGPGQLRKRYANMHPNAFARVFCCRVAGSAHKTFQQAWIRDALEAGAGLEFEPHAPRAQAYGDFLPCFTGVDIGVGREERHNRSAIVTIALTPSRQRRIVDMQSGRWSGPELVQRILRVGRAFNAEVAVESNAAQKFIVDFVQEYQRDEFTVHSVWTTAANKHHVRWGIESVAVEMRAGRWLFPSDGGTATEPELRALMTEMDEYMPEEHTGDRLMALWIAREQARKFAPEQESGYDYTDLLVR